jgi:uncharacterized protein
MMWAMLLLLSAGRGASCATASTSAFPKAIAPDGHEFKLEIASTPEQQARGYMFRKRVGRDEGMLFVFPRSDFHSFWMKNCLVSLDILWLSEDLTIVHLEREVPACRKDPCPSYPSMSKARYVLEIASGRAEKHGMKVGGKISITGIDLENAPSTP